MQQSRTYVPQELVTIHLIFASYFPAFLITFKKPSISIENNRNVSLFLVNLMLHMYLWGTVIWKLQAINAYWKWNYLWRIQKLIKLFYFVTECDGTGEPNVEPQVRWGLRHFTTSASHYFFHSFVALFSSFVYIVKFAFQFLEWVDEGAKCPYCEGLGYAICDVCEGRATIQT